MGKPEKFDHRLFVRFAHDTPDHPKMVGLSDKAFRAWFDLTCWCSRHETNGKVRANVMETVARTKIIAELITRRLIEKDGDDYQVHDYLDFNRSHEEIEAFRNAKGKAGAQGNHERWHVARRKVDPECEFCQGGGPRAIAN